MATSQDTHPSSPLETGSAELPTAEAPKALDNREPATSRRIQRRSANARLLPRPQPLPDLLTVDEVAATLRLSRSKVYELIASKRLAAFRLGGRIRVSAEVVREFFRLSRM